jgi:GT2 family glycosyltransferase
MSDNIKYIAVLLACHNRKEKTITCLNFLYSCDLPDSVVIEVFLVDDGSLDGTSSLVRERFPNVNIIYGNGDLFWNRGMHLAWKTASLKRDYDYYLWLNDDTTIFPNSISALLEAASKIDEPVIVCGAISSKDTNQFTYGGMTRKGKFLEPNGILQECSIINGNCVLICRKTYKLVGNLDPIFPHAIGDHDYSLRSLKLGVKVITTRKYIAHCEKNNKMAKWCYNDVSLFERLKSLYSPLGSSHPIYFFIYEKRHFGVLVAVKHFFSIHLRVFIPTLWN